MGFNLNKEWSKHAFQFNINPIFDIMVTFYFSISYLKVILLCQFCKFLLDFVHNVRGHEENTRGILTGPWKINSQLLSEIKKKEALKRSDKKSMRLMKVRQ